MSCGKQIYCYQHQQSAFSAAAAGDDIMQSRTVTQNHDSTFWVSPLFNR
ncbi:hypothetical protein EPIR_3040 [Erwinia piriflorinigrans CFBP 5888]|uniref:Uncharacterized protein n=1 Tax=Erwinia piriflorinigrans CFBP 5888 TaxID=1161919 RepID=V5ZAW3_9GAMM|nr:hypothetical protein EPIR_3040 [Erwinia piriflorinigrans CFBP 5888]